MIILGIETSCDDTCISIYDSNQGILKNKIYNQNLLYNTYGGIIPEIASREHMKNMVTLLREIFFKDKIIKDINLIAYTAGPGLVSSLLVGATFACSLGFALNIPVLPVNHMEAHLLSPMLEDKSMQFPFIGLLVSGKHTQIVAAYNIGRYKILGTSLDDAAGEAFDKTAKLLGLKCPGGPELSKLALKGNIDSCYYPRPMIHHKSLNFSFSGLKTFTSRIIKKNHHNIQEKANIAKSFEDAVIDILLIKTKKALKEQQWNRLVISGGVSANILLRQRAETMIKKDFNGQVFYNNPALCTDNAAMIAYLGFLRSQQAKLSQLEIIVKPKWSLEDVCFY